MSLDLVIIALSIACLSGFPGFLMPRRGSWGQRTATYLMVLSSAIGLAGAATGLFLHGSSAYVFPWPAEGDSLLALDSLSSFFLVPVFLMGGLGSVYGLGYRPQKGDIRKSGTLRVFWGTLVAGMSLLIISTHMLAFLFGWEMMALSAFFLISVDDHREECRRAGFIYLVATHVSTLVLFGMFVFWRYQTGSYSFSSVVPDAMTIGTMNLFFLLSLVAFGLKAGMMPLHFWLPGAHANAPSHVSAILSGVVIKMGIYGLVRFLFLFQSPPVFWGGSILFLGAVSGLLGVAFALGQHDVKRLLAYHSVENIGIILMGLGLALLGRSTGRGEWFVLGLAGCLLHVWNHGLFKPLLFLGAGSVIHAAGTRRIDGLGGLARFMPWSAAMFLVGAVAICGLPPLNGFVSELFIYLGLIGSTMMPGTSISPVVPAAPVLAMIGALAVACFVKVYGTVFLGMPRTPGAEAARESPASMLIPMVVLAACCAAIGLVPGAVAPVLEEVLGELGASAPGLDAMVPFPTLSVLSAALVGLTVLIGTVLTAARGKKRSAGTWDCGYARPSARMQYTASSFAHTIVMMFAWALHPREHRAVLRGQFPAPVSMSSHIDDITLDTVIMPAASGIERAFAWFRRFQQGLTQHYMFYILITVVLLLLTLVPFDRILSVFTVR